MTTEIALSFIIRGKRIELDNMIEKGCSLNDSKILECSRELDILIAQYFYWRKVAKSFAAV